MVLLFLCRMVNIKEMKYLLSDVLKDGNRQASKLSIFARITLTANNFKTPTVSSSYDGHR